MSTWAIIQGREVSLMHDNRMIILLLFLLLATASLVLFIVTRICRRRYINDPQDRYIRIINLCTVLSILILASMIIMSAFIYVRYMN